MQFMGNETILNTITFLKKISIFEDLSTDVLEHIAPLLQRISLQENEILFYQNEINPKGIYIVISGCIKIHSDVHDFSDIHSEQFFGEYALIDDKPRSITATATEPSELWLLDKERFHTLLKTEPSIYFALIQTFVVRLRQMNKTEELLSIRNKEIEEQKQKIEELKNYYQVQNEAKDKFISIMAHDLKNPFGLVIGFSDLLVNTDISDREKIKAFSTLILKGAKEAMALLENLLMWSRIQIGTIKVNPMLLELIPIIDEQLEIFAAKISEKELTIFKNFDSLKAYGDHNLITITIQNIISNAIKFNQNKGSIIISVYKKDDSVCVSIKDTGIGMTEEKIARLFKIHSPKHDTTDMEAGLGLVLAKEFIHLCQGNIEVSSKPGEGSEFIILLPQKPSIFL